ncbi:hypothetical protein FA13DRAFT_1455718 [Coprinellus micaceus]|uniref:Uncharacterized protein n=1 Tax=Coprinellus micaceus TaxID=71717 RepID=A0A4Y7SPG2_COPMI|nr:hypothetical protein FA13DRAFT_1455718 [Coprinellus micaceus]
MVGSSQRARISHFPQRDLFAVGQKGGVAEAGGKSLPETNAVGLAVRQAKSMYLFPSQERDQNQTADDARWTFAVSTRNSVWGGRPWEAGRVKGAEGTLDLRRPRGPQRGEEADGIFPLSIHSSENVEDCWVEARSSELLLTRDSEIQRAWSRGAEGRFLDKHR